MGVGEHAYYFEAGKSELGSLVDYHCQSLFPHLAADVAAAAAAAAVAIAVAVLSSVAVQLAAAVGQLAAVPGVEGIEGSGLALAQSR